MMIILKNKNSFYESIRNQFQKDDIEENML